MIESSMPALAIFDLHRCTRVPLVARRRGAQSASRRAMEFFDCGCELVADEEHAVKGQLQPPRCVDRIELSARVRVRRRHSLALA